MLLAPTLAVMATALPLGTSGWGGGVPMAELTGERVGRGHQQSKPHLLPQPTPTLMPREAFPKQLKVGLKLMG